MAARPPPHQLQSMFGQQNIGNPVLTVPVILIVTVVAMGIVVAIVMVIVILTVIVNSHINRRDPLSRILFWLAFGWLLIVRSVEGLALGPQQGSHGLFQKRSKISLWFR